MPSQHVKLTPLLRGLLLSTCLFCLPSISVAKDKNNLPLDDLQRFTAVIQHIRDYYVKPVDDDTLFENAIRGMLSGLDPHSGYLDPEEFSDLKINTSGKFAGLGIEVTLEDGLIRVISPIDDSPASKANIHPGDLIFKLDNTPVKGLSLKKAVEMMRGPKGTKIQLTILRKGSPAPIIVPITRDMIRVKSVRSKLLDEYYGYIRISQFQTKTGDDLKKAIKTLRAESDNKLKGLILDLRNNPGGVLEASVDVSDTFLDLNKLKYDGMIVYTEGRLPGSQIKEKAHAGDLLEGAPIVTLINEGSASASEIVAGALQDHKRAIIVGETSFGKGSVQTVLPLKDHHGLKLTTALYFTPAGRSIQATGIVPDITIKHLKIQNSDDSATEQWARIRENDLRGHLDQAKKQEPEKLQENTTGEPNSPATDANSESTSDQEQDKNKNLLLNDYQLNEALNLLKGLVILKRN